MKKLFKLSCVWAVLFSFVVETGGAEGIALLAAPGSAARPLPAPDRVPPPRAAAPTPAPKVVPPDAWGYYVLAFAEIAVEEAACARDFAKAELWSWRDGAVRRGLLVARAGEGLLSSVEACLDGPQPLEEKFAPIDLAVAPPASLPAPAVGRSAASSPADTSVAAADLTPPLSDRILIAQEPASPMLAAVESLAGFFLGFEGPAYPDMPAAWVEAPGLRYRVVYLRPSGVSRVDAAGIHYEFPSGASADPEQVLPQRYWTGAYPVYYHDRTVEYAIELENTGKAPLTNLVVSATEEEFSPEGAAARRLPTDEGRALVASLAPGQRASVRLRMRMIPDGVIQGRFEQTHVRVTGSDASGNIAVRSDAPQAGLIDPPSLQLRPRTSSSCRRGRRPGRR